MSPAYDERRITCIANEIAEAIELASFGKLEWTVPAELFSSAFPGGFAALINQDFIHDSVNFMEWVGLDEGSAATYVEHFAYLNPWAEVWTRMPSGAVFIAERHKPAKTFTNTEFYNDWLIPQGDVLGGVGLKVDASPTDVIYFPMHYPSRFADVYDEPAAEVSRRLVGVVKRAVHASREFGNEREEIVSKTAVVDRSWPAVAVDSSMVLRGANREAENLLSIGRILRCSGRKLTFRDPALNRRVAAAVVELCASAASSVSSFSCRDNFNPMVVSLSRLPKANSSVKSLIPDQTQILVLIKRLRNRPRPPDLTAFGEAFGLTRAEIRLCLSLYDGRSLQEAAFELRLTYETVRHRTKTILQKTGVRGQPGLCALLARYAG